MVAFKLKDAVCPRLSDALQAVGPDLEVRGEIVFFSDGGERRHHYAIIEVGGIHTPLIVPVDRLEAAAGESASRRRGSAETPSRQVC
jgi:hypothetical protein